MRAPWFAVSCCPPNVARTLASLGSDVAATDENALYLAHYATGQVTAALPSGSLTVDVETAYPHEGRITVRASSSPCCRSDSTTSRGRSVRRRRGHSARITVPLIPYHQ